MINFLAIAIFIAAIFVWQARWSQEPFDWLAILALAYFIWSAGSLQRWDLIAVALFLAACVSRAELHRNGVAMPRMWWKDG